MLLCSGHTGRPGTFHSAEFHGTLAGQCKSTWTLCCKTREPKEKKNPLCSSPNLISSSQKYSGRVSLQGEGAFAGNGKPGHMWVCCGIPTSCAPWTTSLTNCQSFSQTSTEHKIAIKRPSTLATQTGINSGSIPEPNNTGRVFQSWNQCLISRERTEDTE